MTIFDDIDESRKLLGLKEFASLDDIKKAYRRKAFQCHPDKSQNANVQDGETMRKLNRAYNLLLEYCFQYKYSFKDYDIDRIYPQDAYAKRHVHRWFKDM